MGVRLTALKDFRADLTAHLAEGLGVAAGSLGGQVNPPLIVVRPADPYLTVADGYCTDALGFDAVVIAPPGDPPAVMDALDDLIDLIRATLREASSSGHKYGLQSISGHGEYPYGDRQYPAVIASVIIKREAPSA